MFHQIQVLKLSRKEAVSSMLNFPGQALFSSQELVLNHVFSQALQLRASDQQHWPHLGALPATQTVGPTTDLLKHLRFNKIPGRLVHVFNSAEEMRIEGVECSHVGLGAAIQNVEKPQEEKVELR